MFLVVRVAIGLAIRGRLYRPWTDAERETAARDDLTAAEIAVLLGRTPQSVASIRTRLAKGEDEAGYRSARRNRNGSRTRRHGKPRAITGSRGPEPTLR